MNEHELAVYIRNLVKICVMPYIGDVNDTSTRELIKQTIDLSLFEMVEQNTLSDFEVVLDESNNTPERIDRNELWVDVAARPAETDAPMISIPVCIMPS